MNNILLSLGKAVVDAFGPRSDRPSLPTVTRPSPLAPFHGGNGRPGRDLSLIKIVINITRR